jgi:hypothetical protein
MSGPPYYVRWCAAETLVAHRVAFSGLWRGIIFLFYHFSVLRQRAPACGWGGVAVE